MIEYLWVAGALVVMLVAVQAFASTWDLVRRVAHQEAQRTRATAVFESRLQAARSRHAIEQNRSLVWAGWRKFEVKRRALEDPDKTVCSFYLAPHDGKAIPSFEPGQFLTFQLNIPGRPKPVVRCYSLSDAFRSDHYRVSIKRVPAPRGTDHPPGVSSGHFHDRVKEGDILDVKPPAGKFVVDPQGAQPVVLIGGGVGITPVLTMLNAIAESGNRRETWFFYGVRNGGEHVMKEHLEEVARSHPNVHLQICYSGPRPGEVEGRDFAHPERISVKLFKRILPSNNYDFYLCGPPPLMDSVVGDLKEWGVPEDRIHFESFGPGAPKQKPAVKPAADAAATAVEVTFARSGKKAGWAPATGSLLELARACDVAIESGCERGDCGTCQTAIKSGSVKYSEKPSYDSEAGTCLVCCAVPDGPLVLDA